MCDCLFNLQIPASSTSKIIIRPSAGTFVTGVAKQYDDTYPEKLKGLVSERDW